MTTESTTDRKTVEVFTAGCPLCDDAIAVVEDAAGDAHDVQLRDLREAEAARRARDIGVRAVPAIVVDGEIAACCATPGISEDTIRELLNRPASNAADVKAGADEPEGRGCC